MYFYTVEATITKLDKMAADKQKTMLIERRFTMKRITYKTARTAKRLRTLAIVLSIAMIISSFSFLNMGHGDLVPIFTYKSLLCIILFLIFHNRMKKANAEDIAHDIAKIEAYLNGELDEQTVDEE